MVLDNGERTGYNEFVEHCSTIWNDQPHECWHCEACVIDCLVEGGQENLSRDSDQMNGLTCQSSRAIMSDYE